MGSGSSAAAFPTSGYQNFQPTMPPRSGTQGRMFIQVRSGGQTSEPVAVHYNRRSRGDRSEGATPVPTGVDNTAMPMPTPYSNYSYAQQRQESEYEHFDYTQYMVSQDTSRDLTLSRIMAADEFLERMEDTEETVRNLIIDTYNREANFPRVMELLGLRGHLQDELLRIQKMLVEDDPELTCLKQFELSHGKVVGVIKQLTVDKKTLNAEDFAAQYGLNIANTNTSLEASEISVKMDSRESGQLSVVSGSQSSSTETGSTQTGGPSGVSMGIKADGIANEADLKKKHDHEESIVAQKFTERLLPKRGQMSKQEVDTLLQDHLRSMHLLRKKQDIEKLRLEEKLAAKRRQRQNIKEENQAKDAMQQEAWSSRTNLQNSRPTSAAQLVSLSTVTGTVAYHTPSGDETQKQQQVGKASPVTRNEMEAEDDEDFEKLRKIVDEQEKEIEELRKDDRAFAMSVTNERLNEQQLEDLLRKHLMNSDEIRKRRQADRDRLTQRLKAKLNSRKHKEFGEYESEEENDDDMDKRMETEIKLQELRKKYQKELRSKGKRLTGRELEDFLERYRQEQEEILKQRNAEKLRTDAKLLEKLAARRRAKMGNQKDPDDEEGLDVVDYDDDEFEDSESEEDEEEKGTANDELRTTLQAEIWSNRQKMTSEDLKAMLDEFRSQQNKLHQMRDATKGKHKQGLLAKLLERKKRKSAASNQGYEEDDTISRSSLTPEPEESLLLGFTEENMKEIQNRDENFVRNISKKIKSMDEDEFARLLKQHLAQADEIRRKQLAERERLNQKLRGKLRNMKKENGEPYSSDEEDLPEDTKAEEQLDVELQQLGSDFQREITKKKFQLSDAELQEYLRKHRENQENLMKRHLSQKARTDAALKKKLAERKQRGKTPSRETSGIDDQFLQHLLMKQNSGELTEDMLADMLRNYLNNLDSAKKRERQERRERREREKKAEKENAMQTASSIVQDHHENKKHFHDMRKREKSALDEKLQRKLSAQRRKRLKEEVVPIQDNSF